MSQQDPAAAAAETQRRIAQMEMVDWVDAYTAQLETTVMAASDMRMRSEVADAEKHIKADLAIAASDAEREQLEAALINQQQVNRAMQSISVEGFMSVRATWLLVRKDLLNVGWDLRKDVEFHGKPNGELWGRQGGGAFMKWPHEKGLIVVTFMRWVAKNQDDVRDPVAYTKAVLERQGITAENFHEHADKLAIRNPWNPGIIVTDRT